MSSFGQRTRLQVASALVETTVTSATATNSSGVDTKGFEACTFAVVLRAIVATQIASVKIQQSDDDGSGDAYADIPVQEAIGADVETPAVGTIEILDADDNTTKLLGTVGKKRWQRCVVTTTTTDSIIFSIDSILGHPKNAP